MATRATPSHANGNAAPENSEIQTQLDRILSSAGFRTSRRRCELLQWSVGRVLAGETNPVKEYDIAQKVFGKPESWDPRIDSSVRVEFNRLRQKLREYYDTEGAQDSLLIEFPFRGYLPVFRWRTTFEAADEPPVTEPAAPAGKRRYGRLVILVLAAVVLGALALETLRRFVFPPPVTTIAVLPFIDLTPGGQRAYLSDGFSEELTNSLAMLKGLRVVARTSAFQFRGKNVDVREIGRRLGAGAIVEGSISGDGTHLRVIVQLNRTTDGTHLWVGQYDRRASDILATEDEVAKAVAGALRVRLTERPVKEFNPGQEALDEYLKGVDAEARSDPASLRLAEEHYENALRIAPGYARAYVRLGSVHLALSAIVGPSQLNELQNSRRDMQTAASLDPNLPVAAAGLAVVNYLVNWDWPAAEAGFRRALELSSTSATNQTYAWALMTRGRFGESEQHFREAIELDPLNCLLRYNLARLFSIERRGAAAREELQGCLERQPNWFKGRLALGYFEVYDHRPEEGLRDLQRAADLAPGNGLVEPGIAMAWAESGRRNESLALLRQIESHSGQSGFVNYVVAVAWASLGDRDRVFYWLDRSVDAHEQHALTMRVDPLLAPYQQDPRMIGLERRIGLLPAS